MDVPATYQFLLTRVMENGDFPLSVTDSTQLRGRIMVCWCRWCVYSLRVEDWEKKLLTRFGLDKYTIAAQSSGWFYLILLVCVYQFPGGLILDQNRTNQYKSPYVVGRDPPSILDHTTNSWCFLFLYWSWSTMFVCTIPTIAWMSDVRFEQCFILLVFWVCTCALLGNVVKAVRIWLFCPF